MYGAVVFMLSPELLPYFSRMTRPPPTSPPAKLHALENVEQTPVRAGLTLPELEVDKRSFALRVDRSCATDVRAPVRIPGLCAGAVGGLPPPPPAGFAAAAPPTIKVSAANATAAVAFDVDAASPEGFGDDGSVVTGAFAAGIGEAILWSRNPRSASLTCGNQRGRKGMTSSDPEPHPQRIEFLVRVETTRRCWGALLNGRETKGTTAVVVDTIAQLIVARSDGVIGKFAVGKFAVGMFTRARNYLTVCHTSQRFPILMGCGSIDGCTAIFLTKAATAGSSSAEYCLVSSAKNASSSPNRRLSMSSTFDGRKQTGTWLSVPTFYSLIQLRHQADITSMLQSYGSPSTVHRINEFVNSFL